MGHSSYNSILAMFHKLLLTMEKRDAEYDLKEIIELDEGFFSTEMGEEEKSKSLKRGRGSQKKAKVLVMAESVPIEGETTLWVKSKSQLPQV